MSSSDFSQFPLVVISQGRGWKWLLIFFPMQSDRSQRINWLLASQTRLFNWGIVPIRDLKEHPKLTLIISTGAFQQGVKGGPQIKCHTRDQWGWALRRLIKSTHSVNSDTFLDQKCWHSCVNLSSSFFLSFLSFWCLFLKICLLLQQHLFSPLQWMKPLFVVVQAASYCLCHGCFVLPRPAAPTEKQGGLHQSLGEMDSTTVD